MSDFSGLLCTERRTSFVLIHRRCRPTKAGFVVTLQRSVFSVLPRSLNPESFSQEHHFFDCKKSVSSALFRCKNEEKKNKERRFRRLEVVAR